MWPVNPNLLQAEFIALQYSRFSGRHENQDESTWRSLTHFLLASRDFHNHLAYGDGFTKAMPWVYAPITSTSNTEQVSGETFSLEQGYFHTRFD
jgi:hypothetical protein